MSFYVAGLGTETELKNTVYKTERSLRDYVRKWLIRLEAQARRTDIETADRIAVVREEFASSTINRERPLDVTIQLAGTTARMKIYAITEGTKVPTYDR